MKLMLLGLAALSSTVSAQTSTTCQRFGASVSCNTVPSGVMTSPVDHGAVAKQGADLVGEYKRYEPSPAEARYHIRQRWLEDTRDLRLQMGAMMEGGRCKEAVAAAFKAGEMELAAQAKSLCPAE